MNPNRVVIGHLGNLIDPTVQVHKAICKRGAYVGFDRLGGAADDPQVPMVMALIGAGLCGSRDAVVRSRAAECDQAQRRARGYAKTLTVFVPKLKAAGASDEVIRQITVDNPRRFLAFVPKQRRPA